MNTQSIKALLRHFLFATTTAVLAATISSSALALPSDASGNLGLNNAGFPSLSPDACYAVSSVNAMGSSNFPMRFRLLRDGYPISADTSTMWFQANNGNIQFQPGNYQFIAVNTNPTRTVRILMSLNCM